MAQGQRADRSRSPRAGSAQAATTSLRIEQVREPVAQAALVERLLVARLEATTLTSPVVRRPSVLDGPPPGGHPARPLQPAVGQRRLPQQLASLAIRFGADRLWRVGLADPEPRCPKAA
jgi:hypothetical protein